VRADQEIYTHGHAPSVLRSHTNRTVANSAAYLADRLVPGATVLDVGCGPGTISIDMATRVAPGSVLAIDATEAPLAGARERAAAAGIDTVTFAVGDAYALDAPAGGTDSGFDVVHAHQVLQHLTDPVAALREMLRVCRTGGVVAARDADYAAMTWYPSDPLLDRWLAIYRTVALRNGAQPDAGRRLLSWVHAAGAAAVTPSASVWCSATPEDRAWWGGMWAVRIVESDLTRQAIDGGVAEEAELRAIAAAWRAWAAHPDGWFTVLHGEVLATPIRG
jgi:ubiquinone/menaquinone biosynthesis C-methylase UbiE